MALAGGPAKKIQRIFRNLIRELKLLRKQRKSAGRSYPQHIGVGSHNLSGRRARKQARWFKLASKLKLPRHKPSASQPVFAQQHGATSRKHYPVLAAVGIVIFLVGGYYLTVDRLVSSLQRISFFQVSEIVYSGQRSVSPQQLREASGVVLHQTSLLFLDLDEIEKRLQHLAGVRSVRVDRNFPSILEFSVVENEPLALLNQEGADGSQLYYIDKRGVPYMQVSPGSDIDFPVITGLSKITAPQLHQQIMEKILSFLDLVSKNQNYLPKQVISEIHVVPSGGLTVFLVDYPFPIFMGNGRTRDQFYRLLYTLRELFNSKNKNDEEMILGIKYIRMDYLDDKVLVVQSQTGRADR